MFPSFDINLIYDYGKIFFVPSYFIRLLQQSDPNIFSKSIELQRTIDGGLWFDKKTYSMEKLKNDMFSLFSFEIWYSKLTFSDISIIPISIFKIHDTSSENIQLIFEDMFPCFFRTSNFIVNHRISDIDEFQSVLKDSDIKCDVDKSGILGLFNVNVDPSDVFRCFVLNRRLIAISGLNHDISIEDYNDRYNKLDYVLKFFVLHEEDFFLPTFVVELIVFSRTEVRVFNMMPFGPDFGTDSLLLSWKEIINHSYSKKEVLFRVSKPKMNNVIN